MRPKLECAGCLMSWLVERIAFSGCENECYHTVRTVSQVICDGFHATANLGSLANRSIKAAGGLIADAAGHFEKIKFENNRLARQVMTAAAHFIEAGTTDRDKFERACALAAAGNVSPIGAPASPARFDAVDHMLQHGSLLPTFQGDVHGAALASSHVLYLADNSGEIGFDSLLLAELKKMGKKVSLVVKQGPFFEDATRNDISFFGIDRIVDEVHAIKGFFVPADQAPPLREVFEKSDLVICKGTGNYEGLADETHGKPSIFMLKLKCGVIARRMKKEVGGFVVDRVN